MKNISLIVNIVLAVAVGVLFILHFDLRNKANHEASQPVALKAGSSNIVYINVDTLYKYYQFYSDIKGKLEDKGGRLEAELAAKSRVLEKNYNDYQDKINKGLVTRAKAAEMEQQLMAEQQNLAKLRDKMQMDLAEEQRVMNNQLVNNVVEYLKEYNKNGRYQFIMSHTYGSNLLYVNDSLDITKGVLKGLNEKYKSEDKR